ncbi:MAG: outer membrane lipoprotein-sorting protein [Candidatus Wallbacteria bacterium]|nr:outer membrane lipoprotein-sorting protein [Candidatus Wallbacteria bacterium]
MKELFLLLLFCFYTCIHALTVEEIIKKVDHNMAPDSVIYHGEMTIHDGNSVFQKSMKIYGRGNDTAFIEFLSPPRDAGTRYLRLSDNLWMFLPRASRTVKISGHMLRQNMMGSDFSYEDQTERRKFWEQYDSAIATEEVFDTREVYVLEMIAKPGREITYTRRKIWVDKENFVVYKSEMYAKSGKLLKLMSVLEYKPCGDRWFATKMRMEDKIKGNSYTEIQITDIELDVAIPDQVFTMQNLERRR